MALLQSRPFAAAKPSKIRHRFDVQALMREARIVAYKDSIFGEMRSRSNIEKFCALKSHLSESPRSYVPHFRYLLALRRSDSRGVAMRMLPSKRRSSFGTNCVQCDNELIAPARSEFRDERQIRHFWHCSKCDYSFEVIAPSDTKSIQDVMRRIEDVTRRRDVCRLRLSHRKSIATFF